MAGKMQTAANSQQRSHASPIKLDRFLVCGLGSLGQQCVVALKGFGVSIIAIEEVQPRTWEIPDIPNLLEDLVIGDCRQESVLKQAKIQQCRAVLLVTSSERINTEAAFTARLLNPHTRLVVRSAKENLNELLSQHLGNFVSFEPTQLPVTTFALAAMGTMTLGFFNLEGHQLRVVKRRIQPGDLLGRRLVHDFNSSTRRVLSHTPNSSRVVTGFHQWEPNACVQAGDALVYVEVTEESLSRSEKPVTETKRERKPIWQDIVQGCNWRNLKRRLHQFWQSTYQRQVQRVAIVSGIGVLVLWLLGTLLYLLNYPKISVGNAFYTTAILLLGGFGDLYGGFDIQIPVPWWLQLVSLGLGLAGTAFVGVLYALLTEMLLSARFQFLKRRPPVPQQDHVVVIGLGRVGQGVAAMLQEFKQSVVGITNTELDPNILPELPVITGNFAEALKMAHLPTAKSVLVATDDEMLNLEVGLMAHAANPAGGLVIRTFEEGLSKNLAQLLPDAQVLCAYALAAEAFAGAAFGENIDNLFRLDNQTILVTEYKIEIGDTLNGLLLAEVAYGYGVVPVLYQKGQDTPTFMPSDDIRLAIGDRMVVLATSMGLRRIEEGFKSILPKRWRVLVEKAMNPEAIFEGANAIARISACELSTARALMHNLPGVLEVSLYKHQAQRLVRSLKQAQVRARLIPIT
ncbi:potassium channel family protein [Allocoleopsis franciscana]|uniref:K+ transport system, NAD-binding component n=1 Tax=Allocoleopsis franciscana PCC 7113 TaxID=1173027 RepID=K9WFH9_9CYAN|nr:NAD(P)-binding protein [Allocoleopsis franciscana]AFZ18546.1 K+ transport system, NAD-binding component [Allocoleopsis franciscana PCC 7113]